MNMADFVPKEISLSEGDYGINAAKEHDYARGWNDCRAKVLELASKGEIDIPALLQRIEHLKYRLGSAEARASELEHRVKFAQRTIDSIISGWEGGK